MKGLLTSSIAWLLLCSVSLGQIKLVESKTETWAGLKNAVLNDDGTITTGPDSKPILTAKSVRYSFETAIPYKFSQLKAKRLPTGERVTLEQEPGKETYWFRSGATEGKYELSYTVFDPEKGIDSDEWIVDYKPIVAPVPGPVDPVNPEPVPDLGKLPSEARKVIVDLVQNMARDIEAVNADIDAGKVKTVMESAAATVQRDIATRNKFKADMNKLLEPRLGKDVLPATAKQTFKEVADGWRSVK